MFTESKKSYPELVRNVNVYFGTCSVCGCKMQYCPEVDSIWCIHCNSWTGEPCRDPECERCQTQKCNDFI